MLILPRGGEPSARLVEALRRRVAEVVCVHGASMGLSEACLRARRAPGGLVMIDDCLREADELVRVIGSYLPRVRCALVEHASERMPSSRGVGGVAQGSENRAAGGQSGGGVMDIGGMEIGLMGQSARADSGGGGSATRERGGDAGGNRPAHQLTDEEWDLLLADEASGAWRGDAADGE